MRKTIVYTIAGISVLGGVLLLPTAVSAQVNNTESTFAQRLAEKLGIDEDQVDAALAEVHDELQEEKEERLAESLDQAVTEEKLTERQRDLLLAYVDVMDEIRDENRGNRESLREDLDNLSEDERKQKMEELRAQRDQELLEKLAENGFETTIEELESAREAARDADVRIGLLRGNRRIGNL